MILDDQKCFSKTKLINKKYLKRNWINLQTIFGKTLE